MNKLKEMYARAQAGAVDSENSTVAKNTQVPDYSEETVVHGEIQKTNNEATVAKEANTYFNLTEDSIKSIINKFLFLKKSETHLTSVQNFFGVDGSVESTILRSMEEEGGSLTSLRTLFKLKELEAVDRVFALMDLSNVELENLANQLGNFTDVKKPILDIQGKTQYLKDLEKMIASIEEDKLGQLKIVGSFLVL